MPSKSAMTKKKKRHLGIGSLDCCCKISMDGSENLIQEPEFGHCGCLKKSNCMYIVFGKNVCSRHHGFSHLLYLEGLFLFQELYSSSDGHVSSSTASSGNKFMAWWDCPTGSYHINLASLLIGSKAAQKKRLFFLAKLPTSTTGSLGIPKQGPMDIHLVGTRPPPIFFWKSLKRFRTVKRPAVNHSWLGQRGWFQQQTRSYAASCGIFEVIFLRGGMIQNDSLIEQK